MTADATIYVGGLDVKVTEVLLWELFLQAGPVGELHKLYTTCRTHYCGLVKEQPPPTFERATTLKVLVQFSVEAY